MNQTWCLYLELPANQSELAVAMSIQHDLQGCEEQEEGEITRLKCHFTSRKNAEHTLNQIQDSISVENWDISAIQQQDWNAKWRESMEPARLTEGIWVSPVWLPPQGAPKDLWIKIEPKMAFGTGHHETTRLVAQAIIEQPNLENARLLDIGTGSGVLCFVAGFMGARQSLGVEIDPVCLDNIAENTTANTTPGNTSFIIGTADALRAQKHYDIVVMNMIRTHSEPLLQACRSFLAPGGSLIWSGILTEESSEVIDSAGASGFSLRHQSSENEWWCGVFE